jgi:hypothetical protein
MRRKTFVAAGIAVLMVATAGVAQDLAQHSGYVDFGKTGLFKDAQPEVEVFLETPLLRVVCAAATDIVPEVGDLISDLSLAQVKIFDNIGETDANIDLTIANVLNNLTQNGWNYVVRLPEDNINILMKTDGENIAGILALIADGDDGIFVNVAGDLKPEKTGKILSTIGMSPMQGKLNFEEIVGQFMGGFPQAASEETMESGNPEETLQPMSAAPEPNESELTEDTLNS